MEPFLSDIPQFIVASVNFLITTAQAQYLIRLDERIYNKEIRVTHRVKRQWCFLLLGWWVLTISSLLVVGRIAAYGLKYVDQFKCFFGWFDLSIVIVMGLGYALLMVVAGHWHCRPWLRRKRSNGH